MNTPPPALQRPNTLGTASLVLSIISLVSIFFIGSCVNVIKNQGGNANSVKPFVELFGGTFALVGLIASGLGMAGLFGRNRARGTAIVGLIIGLASLALDVGVARMF
jgi:hypothetical protein